MHPALNFLSFYSWGIVLATEEKAIQFMQEVGLIPSINSPCPSCPICGAPTKTDKFKSRKLGFRYICSERRMKNCYGTVNPLKNTVMENCKMPFRDVMGIMFAFVKNLQITETINTMMNWRAFREEPTISSESVTDYYKNFTEIAEIIASHHSKQLGGPGKTIVLDDAFLTTRKSNRGRTTTSVVRTLFGIFCKDNHEGLFFRTDQKKKKDLWPLIKEYVHPETTICHGESSSRSTEKMIRRKMALKYYRRSRLGKQNHGGQVWQFIQDVIQVYPGCLKPGIDLLQIDKVLPDKIEICDMMPTEIEKSEDSDVAQLSDLEETDMKDQDIEIHDQNLEMQDQKLEMHLGYCKPGIDLLQVLQNKIELCDLMPIKIERTEDADAAQLSDLEETVTKDEDIEMHPGCSETGIDLLQILPDKYEICNPLLIKIERSEDSECTSVVRFGEDEYEGW
ncbi:DDE_Tnp_IS1595 domain-containing protein [Caerostris extrusa]|uniref:DDE_Tnp_IS1595 domain-containing protein n=1 Tax=Caerostris extrusa TaxID=172846 RepID=A0AAV4NQ08_CAEEX|nr:DDE_Tnp_IS1595 domain-containing protein [Caerostris extrusa]